MVSTIGKVVIIVIVVATVILLVPVIQSLIISHQGDIDLQKGCEVMKKGIITLEHYVKTYNYSGYNALCADRTGSLP
jgi:hypothetical protein